MKRYIKAKIVNIADEDDSIKMELAEDPDSTIDVLEQIIERSAKFDDYASELAASNPNVPADMLVELSDCDNVYVRRGVASNPNTPLNVLEKLASDSDDSVRVYIADRQDISEDLFELLSNDRSIDVRSAVILNPTVPDDILWSLIRKRSATHYLVQCPKLTSSMLAAIADYCNDNPSAYLGWSECWHLLKNDNIPYDRLLSLFDTVKKFNDLISSYCDVVIQRCSAPYDINDVLEDMWVKGNTYVRESIIFDSNTPVSFLKWAYNNASESNMKKIQHVLEERGISI